MNLYALTQRSRWSARRQEIVLIQLTTWLRSPSKESRLRLDRALESQDGVLLGIVESYHKREDSPTRDRKRGRPRADDE
jgi:hypothetical protein